MEKKTEDLSVIERMGVTDKEFVDSAKLIVDTDGEMVVDLSDTLGAYLPLDTENLSAYEVAVYIIETMHSLIPEDNINNKE